ncbi:hypothetical protein V1264_002960 [Littorina saxatilis]|uniref:adenosine deaminase n=1 Tax=Littorina saxatilis TaxID=31220 RepID=A0AAN9G9F3_9CAEN
MADRLTTRPGWMSVVCLLGLAAILIHCVTAIPADYAAKRAALIKAEKSLRTGGTGSSLSHDEQIVDKILMLEKRKLIEATRLNGSNFAARYNFLNMTARADMEATRGFQIIKKMPKGGVLHVHDEAITSIDWLVSNVTYRNNCYMCVDSSDFRVKFHFYNSPPQDAACVWRLVSAFRGESGDAAAFDKTLHNNMSMVVADPTTAYPDLSTTWTRFLAYFAQVEGLVLYAPVFADYLWEGMLQFREDNVQYLEIRGLLPQVYELDGTVHDADWVLNVYKQGVAHFVQQYPDFTGARFIKTSLRFKNSSDILSDVKEAMRLYLQNPGFVVGFDLVGPENYLHPLIYYVDDLLYPSKQNPPVKLPYFFHAGETDWQGSAVDYNLVDALLLNTTRIGHGYALYKHPLLKDRIRKQGIAVEVNPISNQVLKLVDDLRNHPAAALIAENFPLVISSDDPAVWGAAPLSHDFYVTFMTMIGEDAGLATLKQLAINSLRYSAMQPMEIQKAVTQWKMKWDSFIQQVIRDFTSSDWGGEDRVTDEL